MRMLPVLSLLTLSLAACGPSAAGGRVSRLAGTVDNGLSVQHLRATDGTELTVSGTVFETTNSGLFHAAVAKDITVKVANPGLARAAHVRAVVIDVCQEAGSDRPYSSDIEADAVPTGSAFLATLPQAAGGDFMLYSYTAGGTDDTCRQELAVVIDGNWLSDPVNGTHNFKFNF